MKINLEGIKSFFSSIGKIETKEPAPVETGEVQGDISITVAGVTTTTTYTGNPYTTYDSAIENLSKKYEGTAEWGCQQARNIIDVRSAFIIGQGIKPVIKKDNLKPGSTGQRELEFIKQFIKDNDLDEEMPQEFCKESEIEGRILFKLIKNEEVKKIELRHISYNTNKYKIKAADDDYKKYIAAEWKTSKTGKENKLEENEFIYKKFGGRTDKVNDIMPKVAMVQINLENLDKAIWDWRKINHLFAAPTPVIRCDSSDIAKKVYAHIKTIKWNIGKFLTLWGGEYKLVGLENTGQVDSLKEEIIANIKIVSGEVGIPVHFLGFPDLMSNRAVSTDLFEFIIASTNKERHIWVGAYEEMFKKAMLMSNDAFQTGYDVEVIGVEAPYITEAKLKELTEVWLPLYLEDVITLQYLLSKIPDINPEDVENEQNKKAKELLESIKRKEQKAQTGSAAVTQ